MAESKVKDDNFFLVSGWMLNRLNLKGVPLQVFSIIYGFSQDGESYFTGSLQYLSDFTNASKPTIIKAIKELVDKGYVLKYENEMNGVKFNRYKANLQVVKNLNWGSKETLPGGSKDSLPGGSKETLPNNIDTNNIPSKDKDITKEVVDLYNSICVSLPAVRAISGSRKQAIKARLNTYTLDDFKTVFENAEASSFLKGSNDRNWTATFDWLIKDSNMAKVLEGNYADKGRPTGRQKEKVPGWMGHNPGQAELDAIQKLLSEDFEEQAAEAMKRIQEVTG